jgi:SAM-dependent methyltransferase
VHFEACRDEYEAMLQSVGFKAGARLLDAGCGSGSYLSLIADQVAPDGRVAGIDIAPENVAIARSRTGLAVFVSTASSLPFATGAFDAAWCANVLQYFDDDDAQGLLAELQRVVRPGGVVAVKDVDMTALRFGPAPPFVALHLAEACLEGPEVRPESRGSLRGRALRRVLEDAGLVDVWQRSFPIERWAPLEPPTRRLWADWLPYLASLALERVRDADDRRFWEQVATMADAERYVDRPDFFCCELQVLAVGRVPEADDHA